jgi:hypothetical protein
MDTDKHYVPDWEASDSWTEFEWEKALKYSDGMAARYFRMLDRFGDLPDAEELISARLGDQQLFEVEEPLFEDWPEDELEEDVDFDEVDDFALDDQVVPGDSWYFETCPVYKRARLTALGWCNILASVLEPQDRFWGMQVLFSLGRLLSYLALSIGDGRYERASGSIAFGKRAANEINEALGKIDSLTPPNEKYSSMFKLIRTLLLENHDQVVTHLEHCRQKLRENQDPPTDNDA